MYLFHIVSEFLMVADLLEDLDLFVHFHSHTYARLIVRSACFVVLNSELHVGHRLKLLVHYILITIDCHMTWSIRLLHTTAFHNSHWSRITYQGNWIAIYDPLCFALKSTVSRYRRQYSPDERITGAAAEAQVHSGNPLLRCSSAEYYFSSGDAFLQDWFRYVEDCPSHTHLKDTLWKNLQLIQSHLCHQIILSRGILTSWPLAQAHFWASPLQPLVLLLARHEVQDQQSVAEMRSWLTVYQILNMCNLS